MIFGDDEDDVELVEDEVERELTREFTRNRVRFNFVRGETKLYEYDEWVGKRGREQGIKETDRNGIAIEKLKEITGGYPAHTGGENIVSIETTEVAEVTTANVNSREVVSKMQMEVAIPVEVEVKRHPETGEIERKWLASRLSETEIRVQ